MAMINCYPMAVFTSIFNVTGLPAISVPVHHDEVPASPGVQIAAGPLLHPGRAHLTSHCRSPPNRQLKPVRCWTTARPPRPGAAN